MLIDIPVDEISNFLHVLKKELPYSLFAINFIETCNKWKQKNDQLQINLLYTERSMETGVFIGIMKSGCPGVLVTFYAFDNYENDLETSLNDVPLHWKNVSVFEGVIEKHTPIVEKLISDYCREMNCISFNIFSIPKEEALKLDIICPDDVKLAPLTEQHVDEIYEVWIGKNEMNDDALRNSIRYNDEAAYGIFCKTSGKLLSRCLRYHSGFLGALQTVENAHNRGYAKLLLKYIVKKLAEKDILPCCYITDDNIASLRVSRSCGFKEVCKMRNYHVTLHT
ncbi:uncharacterized protein LOC135844386 [Planococcus citri]|uniref:uncharacterized protein LOC135844386 n=1 Tax=Planococcus citri TaxID=170843 RepID=UPI0031F72ABF